MRKSMVVILLVLAVPAWATPYFVDYVGGSDAAAGTSEGTAWQHAPGDANATGVPAAATIAAGDIIVFEGSVTYVGSIDITSARYNNGTSENRITLISGHVYSVPWGAGRAVIDGNATYDRGFDILARDYITIEGFEITDQDNVDDNGGVFIQDGTSSDYVQVINCYIHDIPQTPSFEGYGIEINSATYMEIYYCTIENTGEKAIESTASASYSDIHHNTIDGTETHGIVVSGDNNSVYNNIILGVGADSGRRPGYALKADGASGDPATGNKFYNNLIYNSASGIGLLDYSNSSLVYSNTVYYIGQGSFNSDGGDESISFAISNNCDSNEIRNNIFYQSGSQQSGTNYTEFVFYDTIGDNNIVSNNIIYHTSDTTTAVRYSDSGWNYNTVAWLETASGFENYGTGNDALNNEVVEPDMTGGTGASLLTNAPTGFDGSWEPTPTGFSVDTDSGGYLLGATLGSPYNVDIIGTSRPQGAGYDIGAYEYEAPAGGFLIGG